MVVTEWSGNGANGAPKQNDNLLNYYKYVVEIIL